MPVTNKRKVYKSKSAPQTDYFNLPEAKDIRDSREFKEFTETVFQAIATQPEISMGALSRQFPKTNWLVWAIDGLIFQHRIAGSGVCITRYSPVGQEPAKPAQRARKRKGVIPQFNGVPAWER